MMLVADLRAQNAALREIVAKMLDALKESERYVEGAYECAFPNSWENEGVLLEVRGGITLGEHAASFPVL